MGFFFKVLELQEYFNEFAFIYFALLKVTVTQEWMS